MTAGKGGGADAKSARVATPAASGAPAGSAAGATGAEGAGPAPCAGADGAASSSFTRIVVFVSGSGTNLQALIDECAAGRLHADIALVVASNPQAYGIERAHAAGIETLVFTPQDYADPRGVDARIAEALAERGVAYVVMAGYMRKVTPVLLDAFPDRVVNLHPALLPRHKGAHAIRDAYRAGDAVTGITIHFANEDYDAGPIVFQHEVPILPDDTLGELEARVHAAEHEWYPRVVEAIVTGRTDELPQRPGAAG